MTAEWQQEKAVLEYQIEALTENVRDLSASVKWNFAEVNLRLGEMQTQQQTTATLLRLAVGDGEPGHGRLGQAEKAIETLKRYWWQFAGGVAVILFVLDLVLRK